MHVKWDSLAPTVLRDQEWENSSTRDVRRGKDKSRGDGWWVDGGWSSVKTPHSRKWNQFLPGFPPEAVPHESSSSLPPASTKQRTAEPLTFDGESVRERERVHRRNKRRHVVHYFICTVQRSLSKEISWGYTGKHKDGWMSGRARHEERNGKWKLVKIKDCHSLYWKDQIWLIEDMREMMKQGNEKKSEDTQGQKGKQTELMRLLVPICKVFNSPENFLCDPHFHFINSPLNPPSILRHTHVAHCHLWSCLACWIFFISVARGSQPGNQNVENGTGKRRLGGGGTHLYLRSHRRCTSSKAKIEEEFPQKTNQEDWQRRKKAQPSGFGQHGTSSTCACICASVCRNVKIKHKHTPSRVWAGCGTQGRDQTPCRHR